MKQSLSKHVGNILTGPTRKELYTKFIRENADKSLITPKIQADPSLRYYPEIDDYTMSCGMDRTPNGRIWLAWFGGGDNEEAFIAIAKSDDDGMTFSQPQFVLDGGFVARTPLTCVVGNLWTDPQGKLHLFFMLSLGYYDGRGGCWDAVCENPDDDDPVWTEPKRIWHGCALNKPTVLADGSWLLPINLWDRNKINVDGRAPHFGWLGLRTDIFSELDKERMTWCFISKDNGASWTKAGGAVNRIHRTFDEPMVVERKDGSLMMLQRDRLGITECESRDGGTSWSEPQRFQLSNADSRFFFTKLASGKLLLIKHSNPRQPDKRSHLCAYLSDDDGKTWYGEMMIDDREQISYPDGFQAPDGRIFVQYDRHREHGEILMTVFTEEDVASGRYVSDQARKPYPVIQSATMRAGSDWSV